MNKMFAVMKREYLQAVRKKVFIIMTLLFPFLMAGIMILPGLMMAKGMVRSASRSWTGPGSCRRRSPTPMRRSPRRRLTRRKKHRRPSRVVAAGAVCLRSSRSSM